MWSKIKQGYLSKGFSMQQVSLSEAGNKAISKVDICNSWFQDVTWKSSWFCKGLTANISLASIDLTQNPATWDHPGLIQVSCKVAWYEQITPNLTQHSQVPINTVRVRNRQNQSLREKDEFGFAGNGMHFTNFIN